MALSNRYVITIGLLSIGALIYSAEEQRNLTFFTKKPGSTVLGDMTISIDISIPPQGIAGSDLLAKVQNAMKVDPNLQDKNYKINSLDIGGDSIEPNTASASKLYPIDFFSHNKNRILRYSEIITPAPTLAKLTVSIEYPLNVMIESPVSGSALIEAVVKEFPRYNINIANKENYEFYYIKKRSTTLYAIDPTNTYDISNIDRISFQLKKQSN